MLLDYILKGNNNPKKVASYFKHQHTNQNQKIQWFEHMLKTRPEWENVVCFKQHETALFIPDKDSGDLYTLFRKFGRWSFFIYNKPCPKKEKRFEIISLSLWWWDNKDKEPAGHALVALIDHTRKIVELFDPDNGLRPTVQDIEYIDKIREERLLAWGVPDYQLIEPNELCPMGGPQNKSRNSAYKSIHLYSCQYWVLYYIIKRLMHPNVPPQQLMKTLLDNMDLVSTEFLAFISRLPDFHYKAKEALQDYGILAKYNRGESVIHETNYYDKLLSKLREFKDYNISFKSKYKNSDIIKFVASLVIKNERDVQSIIDLLSHNRYLRGKHVVKEVSEQIRNQLLKQSTFLDRNWEFAINGKLYDFTPDIFQDNDILVHEIYLENEGNIITIMEYLRKKGILTSQHTSKFFKNGVPNGRIHDIWSDYYYLYIKPVQSYRPKILATSLMQ